MVRRIRGVTKPPPKPETPAPPVAVFRSLNDLLARERIVPYFGAINPFFRLADKVYKVSWGLIEDDDGDMIPQFVADEVAPEYRPIPLDVAKLRKVSTPLAHVCMQERLNFTDPKTEQRYKGRFICIVGATSGLPYLVFGHTSDSLDNELGMYASYSVDPPKPFFWTDTDNG